MNNHIDNLLFDYNKKESALNDKEISLHIQDCGRCRKLLEDYFNTIDVMRNSPEIPQLSDSECSRMFENIISRAEVRRRKATILPRVIAVAASVIIILTAVFLYKNHNNTLNTGREIESHIIGIFSPDKTDDLEIISDLELFSNLDIIENLETLEELNEVIDDEI